MREGTAFTIIALAFFSVVAFAIHEPSSLAHDEQLIMDSCTFHHLDKDSCDKAMQAVIEEHKRIDNAKN